MRSIQLSLLTLGMLLLTAMASRANPPANEFDSAKLDYFEKKVRPLLVNHCYTCHSAETKPSGNLRVDDRGGLIAGGNNGPAVVPGSPEKSLLIKRVLPSDKRRMPLEGEHLTDEQIAILSKWIADGAAWPPVKVPGNIGQDRPKYEKLRKEHWAWQPLKLPQPPAVRDEAWPRSEIDRFILAKLEEQNLRPVSDASKEMLIRRVTFDLTGLPPTPEEIDDFLKDQSKDAFAKVVDRLLASTAFGERWGRYWLDVARYGESTGPSRNIPYPHAWRYRDYVIDSVNADVPYDRFLHEQIAGDLLPAANDAERDRQLIATGFLALGVKDVNQRFKTRFIMDNVDEMIDVVTRSALALTVSCARCHDHKFDPIPTTDYYALAGIFTSTEDYSGTKNKMGGSGFDYYEPQRLVALSQQLPPPSPSELAQVKAEFEKARKEWDAIRGTPEGLKKDANGVPVQRAFKVRFDNAKRKLDDLTDPLLRRVVVHGVCDAKQPADTELRIRGEAEKLGPVIPRGFLTIFEVPGAPKVNPAQSGRLELAQWLTHPANPLTPRVAVNRIWQNLFGRGLVSTTDNFGVMGDVPSHPELLDYLAIRFSQTHGWSLKKMIRELVLTRTYQLGSETTPEHQHVDPANALVWRHTPRRLTAEEIRDAVLATAGTLDRTRPQGSPSQALKMVEMRDDGPEATMLHSKADGAQYRSVYLPLVRGVTPRTLEVFDPAEQTLVTTTRNSTTVPAQALFMLNSPFIRQQSEALAKRMLARADDDAGRIRQAYRLLFGRLPSQPELSRAEAFLAEYQLALQAELASQPTARLRLQTWAALMQALYASAEFRFVH
jgi:hypothetical protein